MQLDLNSPGSVFITLGLMSFIKQLRRLWAGEGSEWGCDEGDRVGGLSLLLR